jgi:hypothetical protein
MALGRKGTESVLVATAKAAALGGSGIDRIASRPRAEAIAVVYHLPSVDGLKLARAVRDRRPPVALIVTSGRTDISPNDLPSSCKAVWAISGIGNSSAIGSLGPRPDFPRRSGRPPIQQRDAGRNGTTFDPFRLQASASSTCFVSSATVNGFFISLFCSAPSNFVDPI